ncbi:hypothetical protein [Polaromonas sp.]|uniref:hypothetical protein n=1 Tax=Polaromonas sp. TaxID=1869339 RepID=UPI0032659EDE
MNTKTRKSSQPDKSGKSTPSSVEQTEPGSALEGASHDLVRIHDLEGRAGIYIPDELRAILGDEAYERNLEELRHYEIYIIAREPKDVVYLRMPILAVSLEPSRPASQEPVEAPTTSKAEADARAKPRQKAKPKAETKGKKVKSASKPAA